MSTGRAFYTISSSCKTPLLIDSSEYLVVRVAKLLLAGDFVNVTVTEQLKQHIHHQYKIPKVTCIADYPCQSHLASLPSDKWNTRKKYLGDCYRDKVVLVTSTSYTKDEPLEYLIKALESFDFDSNIVCVITGKGLLKSEFRELYESSGAKKFALHQLWLDNHAQYIELLSCCDLGMSFHCSTSGLDFPMKIIDMLAVGIPVCSIEYYAIQEISKERDIKLFKDAKELSKIIELAIICRKKTPYKGLTWENASSQIMCLL